MRIQREVAPVVVHSAVVTSGSETATGTAVTVAPKLLRDVPNAVVVIESADNAAYADRLDRELFVAARLRLPISTAQLSSALREYQPRRVLCAHSLDSVDESFLAVCRTFDVEVHVLAQPVYGVFRPMRLRRFGGLPWLRVRKRTTWSSDERVKRGVDLTLIALAAPIWLPLLMLIMLAVLCTGSPLYFQVRVGAHSRLFRMVKFATMAVNAERDTGPTLSSADDLRVTRLGRVLRRFRLDELPQLWNVIRGDMSLVGPRPERPEFAAEMRRLPNYELREAIRPGLTGIAQLTGGYNATPSEKLRCDLLYLHSRSLRTDVTLLALTVVELFRGFPRG